VESTYSDDDELAERRGSRPPTRQRRLAPQLAIGAPVPPRREDASFTAELADGRVLALVSAAGSDRDLQLLQAFVNALRLCGERDQPDRLTVANHAR
jgi:hypothetical protein